MIKTLFRLILVLIAFTFGCVRKKAPSKSEEWPRFPATDRPEAKIYIIELDDRFKIYSFFITPDKQYIYVLATRTTSAKSPQKTHPDDVVPIDYRLCCLNAKGEIIRQKDMLRTGWSGGGSFGLLEGQLLLRVDGFFLVLDPKTFEIEEKIPVHESAYISWNEPDMTRDEHQADYLKKFEKLYEDPNARFLYWPSGGEYLIFVQGAKGKRAAWAPMSYEDELLADLKKRFASIEVTNNPAASTGDSTNLEISDGVSRIREMEHLSGGTQLVYPNYKDRTILQYELTLGDEKIRFSTTDRDGHSLRVGFSDNLLLTTEDGAAWLRYEGVHYRIEMPKQIQNN
jgi:hypothetical protein